MNIKVNLKLITYKAEAEHQVVEGTTLQGFMDQFIPSLPPEAHKMLVDKQGAFRGVVLLNKARADKEQTLKDGDELIFLSVVSGG